MLRFNSNYLVVTILACCASPMYAADRWKKIDQDDYNALKTAVFAKKGESYATQFNTGLMRVLPIS